MANEIKIIIADDHKIFLEGLVELLSKFNEVKILATAENGEEVLKLLEKETADVVLTDIDMPQMDGMKLTKEIKKKYPNIKILTLSMHSSTKVISALIKQGVNGYILKNTGREELLEAIKTVASGETFFSSQVKAALMQNIIPGKKANSGSAFPELSERELEVLKLVAAACSPGEIAEKLFISENTVLFHKKNLFNKLDVKNTAGLIKCAMEKGMLD